jgi:hypothetical protein
VSEWEQHVPGCSCTRCTGFPKGHTLSVVHGAASERYVRPLAKNHRRRVLRALGLRAGELDPIGRAYLTHYSRDIAKIDLLDRYYDQHGLLLPDGRPQKSTSLYVQLSNSARQHLAKLEQHLRQTGHDPVEALNAYVRETYGG